jgi:hypothetical protein
MGPTKLTCLSCHKPVKLTDPLRPGAPNLCVGTNAPPQKEALHRTTPAGSVYRVQRPWLRNREQPAETRRIGA